jgi:hypothetical protein
MAKEKIDFPRLVIQAAVFTVTSYLIMRLLEKVIPKASAPKLTGMPGRIRASAHFGSRNEG